jgi:hypothetical protein
MPRRALPDLEALLRLGICHGGVGEALGEPCHGDLDRSDDVAGLDVRLRVGAVGEQVEVLVTSLRVLPVPDGETLLHRGGRPSDVGRKVQACTRGEEEMVDWVDGDARDVQQQAIGVGHRVLQVIPVRDAKVLDEVLAEGRRLLVAEAVRAVPHHDCAMGEGQLLLGEVLLDEVREFRLFGRIDALGTELARTGDVEHTPEPRLAIGGAAKDLHPPALVDR